MSVLSRISLRSSAFFAAAALPVALTAMTVAAPSASARELVMHTASIPNNGGRVTLGYMERGKRYKLRVRGSTHFGTWKPTRRALKNDACYEFNSGRGRVALPVVKNNRSFNLCARGYRSNHIYESQVIYSGNGGAVTLWVYDSDYRDNYGSYYAELVLMK